MSMVVHGQTPPEHIEAYVESIKAEQAEKQGDLKAALLLYENSLHQYQHVSSRYPQWRPDIVKYRITWTANQVERLKRELVAELKDKAVTNSANQAVSDEVASTQWTQIIATLTTENAELKSHVESLNMALESKNRDLLNARNAPENNRQSIAPQAVSPQEAERLKDALNATRKENVTLQYELTAALAGLATLSNRIAEAEGKVHAAVDAPHGGVEIGDKERKLYEEKIAAMKETIDLNRSEMEKVREYKTAIKTMEKENKALMRKIKDLQPAENPN
jgi:dynactin complex subunit